jgi:Fe-S-cluster-containing hydrogenase component 2
MKVVKYLAQVDETKCIGDKLCEEMCPTAAIRVVKKKARVQESKCLACNRCVDRCPSAAVTMFPRQQPMTVAVPVADVDPAAVAKLLRAVHRLPGELVCVCTLTSTEEIAAAIVKGARSVREVSAMTGVLSGCQEFCVPTVQRMLKAAGVDIARAEAIAPMKYAQTFSMWDVPGELIAKHPGYHFEEDRELASRLRNE